MTIATSDSGGGAGIQADLKAFARCGVHGTSAIVALTAQNTHEVVSVETLPRQFVLDQVRAVVEDIGVDAVKIGMLFDEPRIDAVAEALEMVGDAPVVVDPVMVAESGAVLLRSEAKRALIERILPRAAVVTPNLAEAQELTGLRDASPEELARAVVALGPAAAVVTGGHTEDGADRFFDGTDLELIEGPRHPGGAAHGSGCTIPRRWLPAWPSGTHRSMPPARPGRSPRGGGQRPARSRLRRRTRGCSGHGSRSRRVSPGIIGA
jgi:hydroxymethylpyrimidine/phosphomethylpyrimidine kinase